MIEYNVSVPERYHVFGFESTYQHYEYMEWMKRQWNVGYTLCVIYVIAIFSGQYLMKTRPKFEFRRPLVFWNVFLAVFSIIGASRTYPEMSHILRNYGWYHSVCNSSFLTRDKVSAFWSLLFILSKPVEFGDTFFIVVRKQPLIFLHWYHHLTVLLYSWFAVLNSTATVRWFIVMNYAVHSIMYSYYAIRAMGFKLPKPLAMIVTSLQLVQMFVGCAVNIWAYKYLQSGLICQVSHLNIMLSFAMYLSYLYLFGQFFYQSYLAGNRLQQKFKTTKSKTN
ncbi:hypothetical protein HHI36_006160 [Cryptolaemus montrouzieri]|uniref:Elongation of very long chain fatty acids protein n=1 Tax=Cryptolaemus montrouzieri TaxID=559131 RepID=A0ABD2NW90_9CUCU